MRAGCLGCYDDAAPWGRPTEASSRAISSRAASSASSCCSRSASASGVGCARGRSGDAAVAADEMRAASRSTPVTCVESRERSCAPAGPRRRAASTRSRSRAAACASSSSAAAVSDRSSDGGLRRRGGSRQGQPDGAHGVAQAAVEAGAARWRRQPGQRWPGRLAAGDAVVPPQSGEEPRARRDREDDEHDEDEQHRRQDVTHALEATGAWRTWGGGTMATPARRRSGARAPSQPRRRASWR